LIQQHSLAFLSFFDQSLNCIRVFLADHQRYHLRRFLFRTGPMTQEPSTLYAKLLGETASITWKELEPFFARGALLWVDPSLDLIAAAEALAQDEGEKVAAWLASDQVAKLSETRALDLFERDPQLWAVVVSPWILIQERATS
jgi:hypothetical protein